MCCSLRATNGGGINFRCHGTAAGVTLLDSDGSREISPMHDKIAATLISLELLPLLSETRKWE
jgi:hypothetical protein